MSGTCRCPTCAQPIEISGVAAQSPLTCPACGATFALSTGVAVNAAPPTTMWTPGSTRAPLSVRRRSTNTNMMFAIMAAAGALLVVVVLVLAATSDSQKSSAPVAASSGATTKAPSQGGSGKSTTQTSRKDSRSSRGASGVKSDRKDLAQGSQTDVGEQTSDESDEAMAGGAAANAAKSGSASPESTKSTGSPATSPTATPNKDTPTYPVPQPDPADAKNAKDSPNEAKADAEDLSLAEKRRLAELAKLRKMIYRHFAATRRTLDPSRGQPDDFFVVAKFEMPLSTQQADLRFEVTTAIDPSVDLVKDYLAQTPSQVMRDFQVVARYASMSDALAGLEEARLRYDRAKEYQAQLLAYLQAQQRIQATSIRRC